MFGADPSGIRVIDGGHQSTDQCTHTRNMEWSQGEWGMCENYNVKGREREICEDKSVV